MECFGDTAGDVIQLNADEACPFPPLAHKVADPASWFFCGLGGYVDLPVTCSILTVLPDFLHHIMERLSAAGLVP